MPAHFSYVPTIRKTNTMLTLNQKILSKGQRVNVQSHAGFLGCAQDMIPTVTADIRQQLLADEKIRNIVFTGHSAGGAVASLVFLHFLFQQSPDPWSK